MKIYNIIIYERDYDFFNLIKKQKNLLSIKFICI